MCESTLIGLSVLLVPVLMLLVQIYWPELDPVSKLSNNKAAVVVFEGGGGGEENEDNATSPAGFYMFMRDAAGGFP